MRVHIREQLVSSADIDLRTVISDWANRHPDLTSAEFLKVLFGVCHDRAQSLLKYVIREERHGRTDKPGGIE